VVLATPITVRLVNAAARNDKDPMSSDVETDTMTDTESPFGDSDRFVSDTDPKNLLDDIESDIDDDSEGDDDLFEDEVRHPVKHYLAAAANLDM